MNREIEYIVSVTTWCNLTSSGSWTHQASVPASDECVIRQITYSSQDSVGLEKLYLIGSNLNNGVIGSAINVPQFVPCPNTRIQLRTPPGQMTFQLYVPSGALIPAVPSDGDMISITMDLIKYLNNKK